jgi:DNA polymerase III epsilon subunit-like protein
VNVHGEPFPRYLRREDVPRDLRPATELNERGYRELGPPLAVLATEGGDMPLYSTSEARRRRDGMWARRSAGEGGVRRGPDVVTALAEGEVPPPGRARSGTCRICGREGLGLIDGECPSCRRQRREATLRGAATSWLTRLFHDDFVVLDTETTGLGRRDEIIEVGVIDAEGRTLLETLVWPRAGRVPDGARRVHGLGIEDLEGAPTWPEVLSELQAVLAGRRVLAWNAPFDERMARQSSRLWRVPHGLPAFECAMRAYALARGVASGRKKLATAAADEGVLEGAQHHRSSDDARLTLAVLRTLGATLDDG